jgi:hypothetical protein
MLNLLHPFIFILRRQLFFLIVSKNRSPQKWKRQMEGGEGKELVCQNWLKENSDK